VVQLNGDLGRFVFPGEGRRTGMSGNGRYTASPVDMNHAPPRAGGRASDDDSASAGADAGLSVGDYPLWAADGSMRAANVLFPGWSASARGSRRLVSAWSPVGGMMGPAVVGVGTGRGSMSTKSTVGVGVSRREDARARYSDRTHSRRIGTANGATASVTSTPYLPPLASSGGVPAGRSSLEAVAVLRRRGGADSKTRESTVDGLGIGNLVVG